ncbi:hypothetical protein B0H66DRAFT_620284 [Apodospora peruviana]|uniref:Uncharacterized protein n=1 Tax=Apodospora peruviana TaxID=516989 RepID=A0AAE0M8L5_9PEZI|nr:hypothetical protein B0H66DRAFT_620284 [Apodospora peruviana]
MSHHYYRSDRYLEQHDYHAHNHYRVTTSDGDIDEDGNDDNKDGKDDDSHQRMHRRPRFRVIREPRHNNGPGHKWTEFEMRTVYALISKGVHKRPGGELTFSTALNEALNGKPGRSKRVMGKNMYDDDIDVEDVIDMLHYVLDKKKGAVAFAERQNQHCLTRVVSRVFARTHLNFDGSLKEWEDLGRRDEVAAKRVQQLLRPQEQMMRDEEKRIARREGRSILLRHAIDDRAQQNEKVEHDLGFAIARFVSEEHDGAGGESPDYSPSPPWAPSPPQQDTNALPPVDEHEEPLGFGFAGGFATSNPTVTSQHPSGLGGQYEYIGTSPAYRQHCNSGYTTTGTKTGHDYPLSASTRSYVEQPQLASLSGWATTCANPKPTTLSTRSGGATDYGVGGHDDEEASEPHVQISSKSRSGAPHAQIPGAGQIFGTTVTSSNHGPERMYHRDDPEVRGGGGSARGCRRPSS